MDQNVYTIALGALITLVASVTTSILTHILQLKREEKNRLWNAKEKEKNDLIASRNKRISDAEKLLNKLSAISSQLASMEIEQLNSVSKFNFLEYTKFMRKNTSERARTKYLKDKIKEKDISFEELKIMLNSFGERLTEIEKRRISILKELEEVSEKKYIFSVAFNDVVNSAIDEYISVIGSQIDNFVQTRMKLENGKELSYETEMGRIKEFRNIASDLHEIIIKGIDMLYTTSNLVSQD